MLFWGEESEKEWSERERFSETNRSPTSQFKEDPPTTSIPTRKDGD